MKKYILPLVLSLSIFSCKTVQLTDGTYITKRQERKIYEKAFNNSFGQMTEEEVQLFEGVNFQVDTTMSYVPEDTTEKVINVSDENPYFGNADFIIYTELIPSEGDTTTTYKDELIIVNGIRYVSLDSTTWINYRGVTVYR